MLSAQLTILTTVSALSLCDPHFLGAQARASLLGLLVQSSNKLPEISKKKRGVRRKAIARAWEIASIPATTLILEEEWITIVANTNDGAFVYPQEVDERQVSVTNSLGSVILGASINNGQCSIVAGISESKFKENLC